MNHTAAIHVLKGQLKLQDDDYRALLVHLTGKSSCKAMTNQEQAKVRMHMDGLASKMGVKKPFKTATKQPQKTGRPTPSADAMPLVRRIRAQLISLDRKPDSYADGIVKQMLGDQAPQFFEWCQPRDLANLSQALSFQQKREGVPTK